MKALRTLLEHLFTHELFIALILFELVVLAGLSFLVLVT